MPNHTLNYIPADATAAVIEYDAQFRQALDQYPDPVITPFVYRSTGSSLIRRFFVPLHAAGYERFKGTLPFRNLSSDYFDITLDKWADGVAEDADVVEASDFNGFAEQPEVMAANAKVFPDEQLAALVNTAETVMSWDGEYFAGNAHPNSIFPGGDTGTFDNWFPSTALTDANITLLMTNLMGRKGANGKSLGLKGATLLLPTALYETGRRILEIPTLANGAGNPLYNRLKAVHWPQLADTRWAIVDDRPGLKPFVVAVGPDGGEVESIVHDKSSSLYKTSMRVGFNAVLRMGFGLAMPQAIVIAKTTA